MQIIIAILSLLGFLWLSNYSLHEHGYSQTEIEAVSRLVDSTRSHKAKQAKALQELWEIGEEEIAQPVKLW